MAAILFILIQSLKLDAVERRIASVVSETIRDGYGIPVDIGRIEIRNLEELILKDVSIRGLDGDTIISTDRATAHISPLRLLDNELRINTLVFAEPEIRIGRKTPDAPLNIQFILDSFAKNRPESGNRQLALRINQFLVYDGKLNYDIESKERNDDAFDTGHIAVSGFGCNISLKKFTEEGFSLVIRSVKGREKSGLEVNGFRGRIEAADGKLCIRNLNITLPGSSIKSDSIIALYDQKNYSLLTVSGKIKGDRVSPADIASLFPEAAEGLPPLSIMLSGTYSNTSANAYINISAKDNSLVFKGNAATAMQVNGKKKSEMNIESLFANESTIDRFVPFVQVNGRKVSELLGNTSITGKAQILDSCIQGNATLSGRCGTLSAVLAIDEKGCYSLTANGENINLGEITGKKELEGCDIVANAYGNINDAGISASYDSRIENLIFNGYSYAPIGISGKIYDDRITADASTNDPNIAASLKLDYSTDKTEKTTAALKVSSFRPHKLNLRNSSEHEEFSLILNFDQQKLSSNKRSTSIKIDKFTYYDGETESVLRNMYITDNNAGDNRVLVINSDFFEGSIAGNFDFAGLKNGIYHIVGRHLPSLGVAKSRNTRDAANTFYYNMHIKDSKLVSRLFNLPVTINEPSAINGIYDDQSGTITLNLSLNNVTAGKGIYRNIAVNSESKSDKFLFEASIIKPVIRNRKTFDYKNTDNDININISSTIHSDTIANIVQWDNFRNEHQMRGMLRLDASLGKGRNGTPAITALIHNDSITHNDSVWYISEGRVTGDLRRLELENISIFNATQRLSIDGSAGYSEEDSIKILADNLEIHTLLDLFNFRKLKIEGKATGTAYATSLFTEPAVDGMFNVEELKLEGAPMGYSDTRAGWNNERKEIYLNCNIYNSNNEKSILNGFFSQPNDTIDLKMYLNNANAKFLEPKLKAFLDGIEGAGSGFIHLSGHWNTLDLYGAAGLNLSTRVKANNTRYWFKGDTIRFEKGRFTIDKANIFDREGRRGILSGIIKHHNMSKWDCELSIIADNMLVYDTNDYGTMPFYGTIHATGDAKLIFREKLISLKANLRTGENSRFTYNSTEVGGVRDNSFITFTDSRKKDEASIKPTGQNDTQVNSNRINLDFMLDVTDDFGLKVFTNIKNEDYIDLYGNGTIQAIYDSKEGFSMNGKLDLDHGTYKFTIQDIFPKEFSISKGSSIHFQGDPFNAMLDLRTKHLIPSASLGDLTIETSKRKTVKVNCLMNITNTLKSPALHFDLELPEGSEEEKELLASVASTQEQKNMQFIYLLGIGKFYTFDNNANNGNMQTSSAMESLISNTLSGQLNNMLGQIIDNGNWDFSGNFSTSERGWNRMEVEGMLEGRLLNNRLLINGNFGYRDNPIANRSFIGDFEVQWLITPIGNTSLKAYSKTNDRYFSKTNLTTQGGGITFRFDFDRFAWWKKGKKKKEVKNEESQQGTSNQ